LKAANIRVVQRTEHAAEQRLMSLQVRRNIRSTSSGNVGNILMNVACPQGSQHTHTCLYIGAERSGHQIRRIRGPTSGNEFYSSGAGAAASAPISNTFTHNIITSIISAKTLLKLVFLPLVFQQIDALDEVAGWQRAIIKRNAWIP
jgi:hypothetical protein